MSSSPNGKTMIVDSKKLLRQGPLVVTFYYGDWSKLCMATLREFERHYSEIQSKGAHLVALSPQSPGNLSIENSGATFPLLVDEHNQVAKQFGLRNQMDCSLVGKDEPPWPLPMPASYIIQGDKIVYASVSCDPADRAELPETIQAIPGSKNSGSRKGGPFSLRLKGWMPVKVKSAKQLQ